VYYPYDDDGLKLDANYSIEAIDGGFDLIIESRGGSSGGRPPRNTDYAQALTLHLRRMAKFGMVLEELQVASTQALKHPDHERQIFPQDYSLPLDLRVISDFELLRLAIGRASAAYKRATPSGGNPTKKLRLRMRWPGASGFSEQRIAELLSRPGVEEKPTADLKELTERVALARKRIRKSKPLPPIGQEVASRSPAKNDRFVRDPEVIAWVLEEAAGNCENCDKPAPFLKMDGEPFLEVHHVRPLGEGGPDTIDNAAACCPNCHRQLHFGADKGDLRLKLISKVKRLRDFPEKL
jgi:5-methylcytosine-specific restriction protein A